MLYEVPKERHTWPEFQMVDVAIQGLIHSIDEFCHGTSSPSGVLLTNNAQQRVQSEVSIRSEIPSNLFVQQSR